MLRGASNPVSWEREELPTHRWYFDIGVLEEAQRGVAEGNHKLQGNCAHVSNAEMVRDVRRISFARRKRTRGLEQLPVGGFDGIGCQHLPVMTKLLQKHWEWQKDRKKDTWQRSQKRATMYIASLHIETAFDVARPKLIAGEVRKCGRRRNFRTR